MLHDVISKLVLVAEEKKSSKIQAHSSGDIHGQLWIIQRIYPDNTVHVANMGLTWVLSSPSGPMLAPWILLSG